MPLEKQTILKDKYKILSLIGEGGYGSVYKAEDVFSNKPCAVKQYLQVDEEYIRQYVLEAEILKSVNHPCLPKILEYFSYENSFMLVMDYVEGEDLKKILKKTGPIPAKQACLIIKEVSSALKYLHTELINPVLHRDVNPSNIILKKKDMSVVLIDFGLVKFDNGQSTMTAARSVTTGFSPLEQYGQEGQLKTDIRTDVYSLGATLYFLLTGDIPQESISRLKNDYFKEGLLAHQSIPLVLSRIILKSMAIMQDDRFQSVQDFIDELDEVSLPLLSDHNTVQIGTASLSKSQNRDIEVPSLVDMSLGMNNDKQLLRESKGISAQVLFSDRSETNEVVFRFSLPKNIKRVIIRKSSWKFPEDHLDGTDVPLMVLGGVCDVKDQVQSGPVYYTVFFQYVNERKALITREGIKIHL